MYGPQVDQASNELDSWLKFQVIHDGTDDDDNTSTKTTNTTFTLFPSLPPELRLTIWEHTIQPRILLIACITPDSGTTGDKTRAQLALRPRKPSIPALLLMNRESRALAKRHYEPALGPDPQHPRAWFNFSLDALFLLGELLPRGHGPLAHCLPRTDTARVRHVACALDALLWENVLRAWSGERFPALGWVREAFPSAAAGLMLTILDGKDVEWPSRDLTDGRGELRRMWYELVVMGTKRCAEGRVDGQGVVMLWEGELAGFVAGKQHEEGSGGPRELGTET